MDFKHIYILLNKYWNCQTSVSEELELQKFFSENHVPNDLKQYIPIFKYRTQNQSLKLSSNFDKRIEKNIRNTKKNKYITIKIFAPTLRIIASIALIIALGVVLYLAALHNKDTYFAETYNDPKAALKHATYALDKLSDALRMGEEASIHTFQELDNIGIDWSSLDSLELSKKVESETILQK